mgnify:CR=1
MSYLFEIYHITERKIIERTKDIIDKAERISALRPVMDCLVSKIR